MTVEEIKNLILLFTGDVQFYYKGEHAFIDPLCNKGIDKFVVCWNDKSKTYFDIDELMNDTFFNGKALCEIVGEIELI